MNIELDTNKGDTCSMRRKKHVEQLVSAGGVICQSGVRGVEVVVCGRASPPTWALPKGTPEPGESREQTAHREVNEETGLDVEVVGFIDSIEYWFVRPSDKANCHKTVLFYLMAATGRDTSRHDHEFDEVRWVPASEAFEIMTYGNEVEIVKKGLSMASEKRRTGARRKRNY